MRFTTNKLDEWSIDFYSEKSVSIKSTILGEIARLSLKCTFL